MTFKIKDESHWVYLDIQHVNDLRHVEGEDAFEDEDVGAVHGDRLLLSSVSDKVVDRNVNLFALLQSLQGFAQQNKVDCV